MICLAQTIRIVQGRPTQIQGGWCLPSPNESLPLCSYILHVCAIPACSVYWHNHMWQSRVEIEDYSVLVKNELEKLIEALGLPRRCAEVLALVVTCTSSYAHKSALTLGHLHSIRTRYHQHAITMTRFIAVYLRLCDSYKDGLNANGERHPSSKAAAPLKRRGKQHLRTER